MDTMIEELQIDNQQVPHSIVKIIGDGACLFRSLSFLMYKTDLMAQDVRELIVQHVIDNWERYHVFTDNSTGNNHSSANEYRINMLNNRTYGTYCELMAASEIFEFVFEVFRNRKLYLRCGRDGCPVKRLRFTGIISQGHFDVYEILENVLCNVPAQTQFLNIVQKNPRKRRTRFTDYTRKKQLKIALHKHKSNNKEARKLADRKYAEKNPQMIRDASHRYDPTGERRCNRRLVPWRVKEKSGFSYEYNTDYASDKTISLGKMNDVCQWCKALKWQDEAGSICCNYGKVQLAEFDPLPEPLKTLILGIDNEHNHFINNIRKYNSCFQMTSFGAKEVVEYNFMHTFKVQGQVYHRVGSMLPTNDQEAKFLQIYFIGEDERETKLRCTNFPGIKSILVSQLQNMLHKTNKYITDFKYAIENVPPTVEQFQVVIYANRKPNNTHRGRYNRPAMNEVALVIEGQEFDKRDIVLHSHNGTLKRICETHRSYDALQYPLMFCRGEDGYDINIPQRDPITKIPLAKTISSASFYSYRIMLRQDQINHLVYYCSLFSQFLVDMYAKIESERLAYIRNNQDKLRAESYIHLQDAMRNNDANATDLGRMVILPSSFTGGPRYMHERIQDAMTYVRHFGRPDLFITFTCNPKWSDITNTLLPGQKAHDRHDIIARVFHLKVKKLMNLLTKGRLFGESRCFIYTVEWQKRGLPHIHILLWLVQRISPDMIDETINAEIPDYEKDPILHEIIKTNMIHGPCGPLNHNSPCMLEGKCCKRFPKALLRETQTGEGSYPLYRRRSQMDGGFTINVRGIEIDNRWVVPYNPVLSRTFNAHINVEYCNSIKSIKYICKYINKGSDQAVFTLKNDQDEVLVYKSGRYISSSEAVWRILTFPIHERYPPVLHLAVHFENGQRIYFNSENLADKMSNPPQTTLLSFFELCQNDDFAKTLLYFQVPSYYIWKKNKFIRRKQGKEVNGWPGVKKDNALGRVYTVHPNNSECYHLRLLLHVVCGPMTFSALKTVNGIIHPTFKSACNALGLLENDTNWDGTLQEAELCETAFKIRELFTVMLVFCQISDPLSLWEKYKDSLSEDIAQQVERELPGSAAHMMDSIYNKCLILLEEAILSLGGQSLSQYGLPQPKRSGMVSLNRYYIMETNYDETVLNDMVMRNEGCLNEDQLIIYREVLNSIESSSGNVFFLDAPGGTGKTFLLNLLLAKVRSDRSIALAVASSGIAATLLEGGKTAHSTFKLPLNLINEETPMCNISKQSMMAEVLRDCKLIVWDESTMAHKGGFEALSRSLKDIRDNDGVMGGVTVLLAGDFRQTLPVVPRGTRANEVKACVKSSYLWPQMKKLYLRSNMRVHLNGDTSAGEFSDILLSIGNGNVPEFENKIIIPSSLCTSVMTMVNLLSSVYPDVENIKDKSVDWLRERAILTPKNDTATYINDALLKMWDDTEMVYTSIDSVVHTDDTVNYPVEFLNAMNPSGLPPHKLILKIGAPIMLLRNLNPPKLCNGTRLRVKTLYRYVIEAVIFTGCAQGESVFIPRIPLIPSDFPFEFKRLQFPVKVCFAMTINKSQGQSLKVVGIYLREDCFSHGQFYVACSRVSSPDNLIVLANDGKTANVVYKEIFL